MIDPSAALAELNEPLALYDPPTTVKELPVIAPADVGVAQLPVLGQVTVTEQELPPELHEYEKVYVRLVMAFPETTNVNEP